MSETSKKAFAFSDAATRKSIHKPLFHEIPVPEAIESNDEEAWALWEDSVSFQDSQNPEDTHGVYVREEAPREQAAPSIDFDPFSSVTKNGN